MSRPLLQALLAMGLLLLASYYWGPGSIGDADRASGERRKNLPNSYMDTVRSLSFTDNGQLADVLEALHVEQFGKHGYALLTQPRFYSHSRDNRTWSASADRGRYEEGRQRLLLRQHVVLDHDQTRTHMETPSLDIQLDTSVASTRSEVRINQGENRTRASGMIARLGEETIALGPNVESTYVMSR